MAKVGRVVGRYAANVNAHLSANLEWHHCPACGVENAHPVTLAPTGWVNPQDRGAAIGSET